MRMRQTIALAPFAQGQECLPAIDENFQAAKEFAFRKWQERAREFGREMPIDLSGACKFTSLFAVLVFGGQIRGNFFHQWVELPNGRLLDLNAESEDVAILKGGSIPAYARSYAEAMRQTPPSDLYTHSQRHIGSRDHRESMASVRPRAEQWAREFLASRTPKKSASCRVAFMARCLATSTQPSPRPLHEISSDLSVGKVHKGARR
jgi:hypothetical protein